MDRAALIIANRWLPRARARILAARHLPPGRFELDDLAGWGAVGLVQAAQRWDGRGDFAGWAKARIDGAILDWTRSQDIIPRGVREAEKASGQPSHLRPIHSHRVDGEEAELALERVRDPAPSVEQLLATKEAWAILARACERLLPPRLWRVLWHRYIDGKSQDEIGAMLGVSGARVCQLEREAIKRMRRAAPRTISGEWAAVASPGPDDPGTP